MASQSLGCVSGTLIDWAAGVIGISPAIVRAQINQESGGNCQALSSAGAQGPAQFEPATWAQLGCTGSPDNATSAMQCYAKYMYQLVQANNGNIADALAEYNAGSASSPAGQAYAASILAAAGQPDTATASGGTGATTTAASSADCLWQLPSLPVVGSLGCILSKGNARAILGGMLMAGSAFGALVGLLIIAAAGFRDTGAARAAGGALEGTGAALAFVPGLEPAGLAVGAAGSTARRAGSSGAASRSLAQRRQRRSAEGRRAAQGQAAGQRRQAAGQRRARAAAPVSTTTQREPIEGGTRITRRTVRGGTETVHVTERTKGTQPGQSRTSQHRYTRQVA